MNVSRARDSCDTNSRTFNRIGELRDGIDSEKPLSTCHSGASPTTTPPQASSRVATARQTATHVIKTRPSASKYATTTIAFPRPSFTARWRPAVNVGHS
jgi:hypothetical protein